MLLQGARSLSAAASKRSFTTSLGVGSTVSSTHNTSTSPLSAFGFSSSANEESDIPGQVIADSGVVQLPTMQLELGGTLTPQIAWESWGDPSLPAIYIIPSFSHGAHCRSSLQNPAPGWWEMMIGPDLALDTNHFYVVSASGLGFPDGTTTSPTSPRAEGEPVWGPDFPRTTPRDLVKCHKAIMDHLGLEKPFAVVGGSFGGMQTLQFAAFYPDFAHRIISIAATGQSTSGTLALRKAQRDVIQLDPAYNDGRYEHTTDSPTSGLAVARGMAMQAYRSREELESRFPGEEASKVTEYLDHVSESFALRSPIDANSYIALSQCMDRQNIVPYIKELRKLPAPALPTPVLIIGVHQDSLIPLKEQKRAAELLKSTNQFKVRFQAVDDPRGHDAMFVKDACEKHFAPIISKFLQSGRHQIQESSNPFKTSVPLFLDTIGTRNALARKFPVEDFGWLHHIGHTPLVKLEDGLFAKMEGNNPSGSIKDRSISATVMDLITNQDVCTHCSTFCLVSSGSAGLALVDMFNEAAALKGFEPTALVIMPERYADGPIPQEIMARPGVRVFESARQLLNDTTPTTPGQQHVLLLPGAFIEVRAQAMELVASQPKWILVDQHRAEAGMHAHETTATEIFSALPHVTDVVCTTGTGATAAGLRHYLPSHVRVHARPAESGTISGLTDVRRYNNFCDDTLIEGYRDGYFDPQIAKDYTQQLLMDYGIESGPSSGAALWLARKVVQERRAEGIEPCVVFISADGKRILDPSLKPVTGEAHGTLNKGSTGGFPTLDGTSPPRPMHAASN